MSTVAEIIDAVKHLTPEQKDEFLSQLQEIAFEDAWDEEIAADAAAGRLDFLWREAQADIAAGRIRPLSEVIEQEK